MKNTLYTAAGVSGSLFSIATLVLFMGIDFFSGLAVDADAKMVTGEILLSTLSDGALEYKGLAL